MVQRYDAIVIGTGQSGPSLAVRLAQAGRKTAIIERNRFGGTCVNTGCIPTKTLIASARVAHMARRAAEFGVLIDSPVRVDMAGVKARKDLIVRQSTEGVADWLKNTPNLTVIEGHGCFESPHAVRVNGELLEADEIFINVGGRAAIPDIPGLDDIDFLTNSSMMEVDFLPQHLVIVGGSYIGLEFAQMYRRFGSEVTVIEGGPRLIGREDEQVSASIRDILEHDGIQIRLGAKIQRVEKRGDAVVITANDNEASYEISGSHLLLAVGRIPNTDDLGLDKAGIKTDQRGYIVVDDKLCTNVPGIWALGDVNGRGAFTHTSYNDYEIVAANLLDNDSRSVADRIQAYALFIDPPLGRIGMTEREVRASGRKALVCTMMMTRVGRARERSETQGYMSVLVDAETKKILGAMLLGIEGDEVIHSILDVMYAGATYTTIQRAMHIHPTVSELVPTLLGDLKPLSP
ncbi:Pyruvate/2-oxoglutarate dehydrogenase complex, dihydrolipoamide dehydrogenase (E3) component [Collimonas sp. OK307]|uniref:FAD-containing oxidoreductase n=1 Tax=Collimonas sp. OK307 TaxID=1801620 RepID=UPI0008F10892|nr:FAD-containing oxidoreductase [Collimonas sp. OK307]SFH60739.1 Pyruvate/2-oxoglutarate dehydrogenase complex, dihydrolipoamide dehydrogenase (E3) component [Collimonas sp. OK307]